MVGGGSKCTRLSTTSPQVWIPFGILGLGGPTGSFVGPTVRGSHEGGLPQYAHWHSTAGTVPVGRLKWLKLLVVRACSGAAESLSRLPRTLAALCHAATFCCCRIAMRFSQQKYFRRGNLHINVDQFSLYELVGGGPFSLIMSPATRPRVPERSG